VPCVSVLLGPLPGHGLVSCLEVLKIIHLRERDAAKTTGIELFFERLEFDCAPLLVLVES